MARSAMLRCLVAFGLLLACNQSAEAYPRIDIFGLLPRDSELVVYSGQNSKSAAYSYFGSVALIGVGADFPKEFAHEPVAEIAAGSRNFRRSRDIGLGPYDGSAIVVFANDVVLRPQPDAVSESIGTYTVQKLVRRRFLDTWTIYIAQLNRRIIVFAMDRASMEETLLKPGTGLPATVRSLRRFVDEKAPAFAIRKISSSDYFFPPHGADSMVMQPIPGTAGAPRKEASLHPVQVVYRGLTTPVVPKDLLVFHPRLNMSTLEFEILFDDPQRPDLLLMYFILGFIVLV